MYSKDRNGVELKQHDVVRFTEDYNLTGSPLHRCPKGTLAVVSQVNTESAASSYISLTLTTGYVVRPLTTRIEKVPGTWVRASDPGAQPLVPGTTLVRPIYNITSGVGGTSETFEKYGIHVLVAVVGSGTNTEFRIKQDSPRYSWARANFEVFVPVAAPSAANPRAQAMRLESARDYVKQLREANPGAFYRVRSRSWDNDGLYAAIEQVDTNGKAIPGSALYTAARVAEALQAIEATKVPIDVVGTKSGGSLYWSFVVAGQNIPAPDLTAVWSEEEIRSVRGIAAYQGKKYRLCQAVTTVVPFVS